MSSGMEVSVGGIELEHPFMNAAGTIKLLEHVKRIASSATSAIMVGSITFDPREGNPGKVYWSSDAFSLNALGLPNPGISYYKRHIPEMVTIAHDAGKPLFVSVAGFTRIEYITLAEMAFKCGADLVEFNLGCPNVWDNGEQKGIFSFDPDGLDDLLIWIKRELFRAPISLKLSPFSDPYLLKIVGGIIAGADCVSAVTASNCFPNATEFNSVGKPQLDPGGGLSGLGGRAMKPIALGQVRQFKAILPEHIQVISAGGIMSGRDLLDHMRAGAVIGQTNTAYSDEGEGVFGRVLQEYVEFI